MRTIFYITGSRAEYGVMKSVLTAINDHPCLDLSLVVTGMHLMNELGYSVQQIRNDGFKIESEIGFKYLADDGKSMVKSVGDLTVQFADLFATRKPDIIFVEGDRGEMLAAAMVGGFMNIPVVHSSGGDISGSIDNSIRHAITRFAHIHFPITSGSAERLIKMGEEPWRIYMFGTPGIGLEMKKLLTSNEVMKQLGFQPEKPLLLVIQHPVTTEAEAAGWQMEETLKAISELNEQTVLIYPNSDAGSQKMIKVIEDYNFSDSVRVFKNLDRDLFLSIMSSSSVMIGNSSSALVEAPYFNLPSVNIGSRQSGRERSMNVIDVIHDKDSIKDAIVKAIYDEKIKANISKSKSPYSGISVGKKIAEFLSKFEINEELLQKKITY
jgi:GDP/UDP-N,N'-diacetylbacillosamine 2-epimerase (hydrolysing)